MIGSIQPISTKMTIDTAAYITPSKDVQTGIDDPIAKTGKKTECQTCKNRKYVDGSNEMVSFKSPTKISPEQSATKVRAHEQEHVGNAYTKAAGMNDGKVMQASVALKMAICPECGRSYIAGGTTTTQISYQKDNPYSKNQKSFEQDALIGSNFDQAI